MEIEVQSPYDTKVGAGPIITGRNWRSSPRMNKIGAFSFEMPLNDPRRSYLVQKRYVRCYGMVDGTRTELGKPGIIDSVVKEIDANGIPTGMLRVSGRDLLAELADINIHELDIIGTHTRSPDAVEYYDGTATAYINMANAHDETGASVEIPADDEDWFYVGDDDLFDIVTFDLGANLNDDHANFKVQYSLGGASWAAGTILSDTTKVENASFGQDGAIRWERQEDWATDEVNSIADKYWLRFRYGEDMSGDVTIVEITITEEFPPTTALADWLAYTDAAAGTPISDLGWDFEATHTETENEVFLRLRDVTAFEALTLIAEQTGENFRLGTGRVIEWLQDDKTASGIRAINISDGIAAEDNEDICLITNLRETEDSYALASRIYPQGGGGGSTRVTLLECNIDVPGDDYAGYTLSKSANYLKKDSVEVDYGRRFEMAKFWPGVVSPVWASSRDVNSANALFDLAYEYLSRHWEPQKSYIFSVVKLDAEVKVGETIQLVYWQTVEGTAVWNLGITAALHLWILEITHAVDMSGTRVVGMQVATIDAWPSSDAGKVKNIVSHVKLLQTTEGPISARSLTADSVADLLGSLDLSAYYKKPTDTRVILGLDAGNVPPGNYNAVVVGKEAGLVLTSGADNTYLGYRSGRATTTGYDNTMVGSDAMRLGLGTANTGVGYRVLENVGKTTGALYNTAVGHQAGRAIDEGDENVAIGADTLSLGDPSLCVAIGYGALENAGTTSDGDANTGVGADALSAMDEGHQNTAIGYNAMGANTEGDHNTALGDSAMYEGAGSYNIAIGRACLHATTAVNGYNIAIGDNAGYNITSGIGNIAIGGAETMMYSTTGNYNVIIGHEAGVGASPNTFANNVIMGYQGGYALRTGGNNVLIGHQAGLALTGGSNVFIGYLAGSQAVGVSNQLYIENSNSATPLIYGEFDNDLVKIHGDLCLGAQDGGGRLNFTEGTTITDGIVWGSDANKVTLYRSADDILKTDDSLTVAVGVNVGAVTGAVAGVVRTSVAFRAMRDAAAAFLDLMNSATGHYWHLSAPRTDGLAERMSFYWHDGSYNERFMFTILGQLQVPVTGSNAGILLGGDAQWYRSAANMMYTPDALTVALGLNVGTATAATAGDVKFSANLIGTAASAAFLSDTADASDTKRVGICGGGALSVSRGAQVVVYGNEHATDLAKGDLRLIAGNGDAGAHYGRIRMYTSGVEVLHIDKDGHLLPGVSNEAQSVGSDANEWLDVWALDQTINHGGMSKKWDVQDETLGLDFIGDLRPVGFRWKGRTRLHHGLVGDEVAVLLARKKIDTRDFAGYIWSKRTKQHYLRYGEFIGPTIRAVQELNGYRLSADAEREAIRARLFALETP